VWSLSSVPSGCADGLQGVKQVRQAGVDARYVFIAPPSFEALESRLRGRGTEMEESIQKRLKQARLEIVYSKTEGVHDVIIVNDDKEKAYKELEAFIFGKTQEQPAKDGDLAGKSDLD
jgi:guanylate kinase